MNKFRRFLFFLLFTMFAIAQNKNDSLQLHLNLKWENEPLELNKIYHSKSDSIQLTTVKFYIS